MRFSTTLLVGIIAALSVHAQEDAGTSSSQTTAAIVESTQTVESGSTVATSTSVVADTTTSIAPLVSGTQSASAAEESRATCLSDCGTDNDCRAKCATIANSVNLIADCQTGCVKGNGTAADDLAYKNCYQGCIETATSTTAAATTTKSGGESTETGSDTAATDGEDTASKTAPSGASGASAAASSSTTGAATKMQATFSAAGILGVAAFMLAL